MATSKNMVAAVAAKMPSAASRARRKDDISEKDEFHLPQIVSKSRGFVTPPRLVSARRGDLEVHD